MVGSPCVNPGQYAHLIPQPRCSSIAGPFSLSPVFLHTIGYQLPANTLYLLSIKMSRVNCLLLLALVAHLALCATAAPKCRKNRVRRAKWRLDFGHMSASCSACKIDARFDSWGLCCSPALLLRYALIACTLSVHDINKLQQCVLDCPKSCGQ